MMYMLLFISTLLRLTLVCSIQAELTRTNQNSKLNDAHVSHRKLIDTSSIGLYPSINEEYIVVLKNDASVLTTFSSIRSAFQAMFDSTTGGEGTLLYTFSHVFNGALVSGIRRSSLINLLDEDDIEYATPNKRVSISAIQNDVVWGLDRIDQESFPLSNSYQYNYTGTNVTVFVLDTGINANHSEFRDGRKSRVKCFFNAFQANETCSDLNGHGTHVAATIGGKTFGVAKNVSLRTVKVLGKTGYGDDSGVIMGIEKIIKLKKKSPKSRMVINMSLGGELNKALNTAANAAVDNGIFVAVAGGNLYASDACDYSPSSATKVVTVGSTEPNPKEDRKSRFSNEGPCIDIFAPGTNVTSASIDCPTCNKTLSGTSMASPHVAGAAALYMERLPSMTAANITRMIKRHALKDKVTYFNRGDTPNLFLQIKLSVSRKL